MIENNEPSSKKMFSTKTKERPNLINQDNEEITIEKKKRLLKEEKIREYQKNQKRLINKDSPNSLDLNDNMYNIDIIKDTFDIDEDFLNKDGCTAITLGLEPMPQRCYVCSICDVKKEHYICNYCYLKCHEKCRLLEGKESPKSKEENNYMGDKEFACYCGNILKHKVLKIPKISLIPCSMIQLDETLGINVFYCATHQKTLCCICSVECHKKCKIIKYNEKANEIINCQCNSEKHTIYNEVAFMFPLEDYKKLSGARVWPIQVLNILFEHKNNFENLIELFSSVLNSKEISPEKQERFFCLLELFTNVFNRKFKTFYFQEDMLNMFKFDNLVECIQNINITDASSVILKFRLFFALLFLHFKRDFQMIKCFTSIDFITKTILERIEYRKILSKPSIYTSLIDKKYDLQTFFKENNVLKMIVIEDICNLIEVGMDYLNVKDNRIEFEFGLKYICFMVKKMIFTKEDIKKLIKSVYIFYNRFFEFIQSDINNNLYPLLDIFNILIELFFMFTVSYNDLTIMEYFEKNKNLTNIDNIAILEDFIHSKSEHGGMLFKMVLRTCEIFQKHYELIEKEDTLKEGSDEYMEKMKEKKRTKKFIESKIKGTDIKLPQNGGLFSEKVTILFTQTLNMFCLADNIYFNQIKSITKDDLVKFYSFIDKINSDANWEFFNDRLINDITENLYNLKIGIEAELNSLFISSYSPETLVINAHIYKKIQNFSDRLRGAIMSSGRNLDLPDFNRVQQETTEEIREKSLFFDKISNYNYSTYLFVKEKKFIDAAEELVDLLIISNLDETLGKVLVLFSNRNYPNLLNYELLDIIFSTMSLYFYSRRGMKYFLLGKNITRLNKVLNRFDCKPDNKNIFPELGKTLRKNIEITRRTLDFFLEVTDGLIFYDLSIKNHKVLKRMIKNLIVHVSTFNQITKQENLENEFLLHFTKIINIFYNLSNDFDQEELTQIKRQILYVFKENDLNIFNKESFKTIFNSSASDEQYFGEENEITKVKNTEKKSQFQEYLQKVNWKAKGAPTNMGRRKLLIDLYFAFFNLMGEKSYYTFISKENADLYDNLYTFNDLEEFQRCFFINKFNLKQKIILLKYLRGIYFMDILNEYDYFAQQRYLTTNEYKILLQNNLIKEPNIDGCIEFYENEISQKKEEEIKNKYFLINQIHFVIQIYLNELKQFPRQFIERKTVECKSFYKELILGIKFITNFYYFHKDLWPKIIATFYQLCYEYLTKIEILKNVYTDVSNCKEPNYTVDEKYYSQGLEIIDDVKENKEIVEINNANMMEEDYYRNEVIDLIKKMNSINFDIFDTKNLYTYMTEHLNNILKFTNLSGDMGLQSYLEVYDTMAEANFTPFSLVETLDYEYFYEEDQKKDEELIAKDFQLYQLKNVVDTFLQTFVDITNSNFIDTLTSYSEESLLFNYRQKFVDYFNSFLNSKEGNCSTRLEILICIITRMCFYDSENMQEKFEEYVHDDYFFPNLNKLINYYIVVSFSVSKNIFAYQFAERVSNITKLLIQFVQALGEGFNKTYHNNIFRFQSDIPKKENEEHAPQDMGHEGDSTSLESSLIRNSAINERISENEEKISSEEEDEKNKKSSGKQKNSKNFEEFLVLDNSIPDVEISRTIYESVIINLKRCLFLLDLDNAVDCEMPYDKLIILITNLLDFLIEYIETEDDKKEIIYTNMNELFFGSKTNNKENPYNVIDSKAGVDIIFMKIKEEEKNNKLYLLRKKVICYVKNKFLQLLIYYLLPGNKKPFVESLINKRCSTIELYLEILYLFHDLLKHLELKNPDLISSLNACTTNSSYVNKLISFYTYEQDFRNMIELPVILKLFILIKIYEDLYDDHVLKGNFEKMKQSKMDFEDNMLGIRSKFSYRVYQFLEIVVVKVEIRQEEEKEGKIVTNVNTDKIAKKVINLIKENAYVKQLSSKKILQNGEKDKISDNLSESSEEQSDGNEEDFQEKNEGNTKITFFPRPYLTFCLNDHSKKIFEKYVDRSTATNKFVELINYSDHFLFEMIVNYHMVHHSPMLQFLSSINYFYVEIINYILIIIQNIIIIIHFYNATDLPPENYDIIEKGKKYRYYYLSLIVFFIQSAFLIVFIVIWYIFKFIGCYQLNLMKSYNKFFVFKKKKQEGEDEEAEVKSQIIIDYFKEDTEITSLDMYSEISKNISTWDKIYLSVVECSINNREVNMLIYNLIFNILFISTRCYIFLTIPILFIANIIPTLFDIFFAMKTKFLNMLIVLMFEYFVIYIFMWITYFYLPKFLDFDEVLDPHSQSKISEKYCYSSLQCYMMVLNYGSSAGGGLGDVISMVSYRSDVGLFIGRFFYDMLFFILIVLVLGNIFLGIIVDSFGDLRKINIHTENDVKNICFICQLSRDACLTRNIDFEKHVSTDHNKWNYVYFLTYLHINNPNDFSGIENSVWEKLEDQDFGWIPIEESGD